MTVEKRLFRSRRDRMIAGVCGGIANYFGVDPTIVRLAWVVLSIFPGSILGGVLVYAVFWLVVPEAPVGATAQAAEPAAPPPPSS